MVSGLKLPENKPKTPFEAWLKQRYPVLPPNFTIADMKAAWEAATWLGFGDRIKERDVE